MRTSQTTIKCKNFTVHGLHTFSHKWQLEKNVFSGSDFNEEFYLLFGQRLKLMLLCKPHFLRTLSRYRLFAYS